MTQPATTQERLRLKGFAAERVQLIRQMEAVDDLSRQHLVPVVPPEPLEARGQARALQPV